MPTSSRALPIRLPSGKQASAGDAVDRTRTRQAGLARSDMPGAVSHRLPAGNDAVCEDPTTTADEVEAWARHALAANGFGDAPSTHVGSFPPNSWEAYYAARVYRAVMLRKLIVRGIAAIGALADRGFARLRQRRQARTTYDALEGLDDRELRDLGISRSEIGSIAAKMTGEAQRTRVRSADTAL